MRFWQWCTKSKYKTHTSGLARKSTAVYRGNSSLSLGVFTSQPGKKRTFHSYWSVTFFWECQISNQRQHTAHQLTACRTCAVIYGSNWQTAWNSLWCITLFIYQYCWDSETSTPYFENLNTLYITSKQQNDSWYLIYPECYQKHIYGNNMLWLESTYV